MIKKMFKNRTNRLFILLVLSLIILPITYSRYIESEIGSAKTYLAKWDVSLIEDEENELELVAKNTSQASYSFDITSMSEVACDYSLKISNIPAGVTVKLDGGSENTPVNGVVTLSNVGGFEVGSKNTTNSHVLTFITSSSVDTNNIDLDLEVEVKQRV